MKGLTALAVRTGSTRLATLARQVDGPVTVAVSGRPGVGVGTVRAALRAGGVRLVGADPDVAVRVIAELAKPEDVAALADAGPRALVILNKADLSGFTDRCPRTGTPVEPMVALLAVAGLSDVLDEPLLAALRVLVGTPADLTSPDTFVAGSHPVSRADRECLIERLDLFGIAHAVRALREHPGTGPAELQTQLRRVSRVDAVGARIDALTAEVRYARMLAVLTELEAMAGHDADVDAFLGLPGTVAARAAAATAMLRAAGLDPGADIVPLRRAQRWRGYGAAAAVSPLYAAAAVDIARAALREMGGRAA